MRFGFESNRWPIFLVAAIAAIAGNIGSAKSDERLSLYVIAHPGVEISAGDVTAIYLGEKSVQGSVRFFPVDNGERQPEFLSRVLSRTGLSYYTEWAKKTFRDGLSQPRKFRTDAEVLDFVRNSAGAIGYVSNLPPSGVVMIQKY